MNKNSKNYRATFFLGVVLVGGGYDSVYAETTSVLKADSFVYSSKSNQIKARSLFESIKHKQASDSQYRQLIKLLIKEGYLKAAEQMADAALSTFPDKLELLLLKSIALRLQSPKKLVLALNLLQALKLKKPKEPKIRVHLAYVYLKQGEILLAQKEFNNTLALNPGRVISLSAQMGLLSIYKKTNQRQAYQIQYQKVVKLAPQLNEILYIVGTRNVVYTGPLESDTEIVTPDERIQRVIRSINQHKKQLSDKLND